MISQEENVEENSLRKMLSSEDNSTKEHRMRNQTLREKSQEFPLNNLPTSTVRKDQTIHSEIESSPSLINYGNMSQIHHIYNNENSLEEVGGLSAKLKQTSNDIAADDAPGETKDAASTNRLQSKWGSSKSRQFSSSLIVKDHRSVNSIEKDSFLAAKVKFNPTNQRKERQNQTMVKHSSLQHDYSPSNHKCLNSRDFNLKMTSEADNTEYDGTQH